MSVYPDRMLEAGRSTCAEIRRRPFHDEIGDDAGFLAATSAIESSLRGYARRLDPFDWEDLVQDALMRAWRGRASYRSGTNFKAWLFTILRNCFRTAVVRRQATVPWAEHLGARIAEPADQESALFQQELQMAVAALGDDQRAALVAITEDQLSYAEAAERLGITMTTLKSRVFRARGAVMNALQGGDSRKARSRPTTSKLLEHR